MIRFNKGAKLKIYCRICGKLNQGKYRDHKNCIKRVKIAKRDLAGAFNKREGL